jgi:hypothetical protein
MPLRGAQGEDSAHASSVPLPVQQAAGPPELPDDLDQRVRQSGEWQLEDW